MSNIKCRVSRLKNVELRRFPPINPQTRRKAFMTAQRTSVLAALGIFLMAATLSAQVQPPPAPWRGAGPTPCVGSDHGVIKCAPAPPVIAVRAGRLFDSKTGQMLTKQVVILDGERITSVGPEGQIKIPAGAQVIDLSQATVLPGLID